MLVFGDCDLERAVCSGRRRLPICGQGCSPGIERIYVEQPLFERFVSELAARARALRIGHGLEPSTELGPMIRERQRTRMTEPVDDALLQARRGRVRRYAARDPASRLVLRADRACRGTDWWPHRRRGGLGPVVTVEPFANEDEACSGSPTAPTSGWAQASRATGARALGWPGGCRPDPCGRTMPPTVLRGTGHVGWLQGIGLQAYARQTRSLRPFAREVRRDRLRTRPRPVVVPGRTLCPRGLSRRAGCALCERRPAACGARLGGQARSGAHGEAVPGPGMSGELSHVDEEGRVRMVNAGKFSCAAVRRLGPSFVCPLAPPSVCMSCRRAMRSRRPSWPRDGGQANE